MSRAAVEIDVRDLSRIQRALLSVQRTRIRDLMDSVGAEVESQTRRRISSEKRAPDGSRWPAWSRPYALTRHGNHGLLEDRGHLLDSITHNLLGGGDAVEVGSNMVYAAIHNSGGKAGRGRTVTIPQRQFLGLSPENGRDVLGVVDDFLRSQMRRGGLS